MASPNDTAKTQVDIDGDLALREGNLATPPATINNLNVGNRSFYRFYGAATAADFDISGLTGGVDGKIVILANHTPKRMKILHNSVSSSVGNRFWCNNEADIQLDKGGSAALIYSAAAGYWFLFSVGKP